MLKDIKSKTAILSLLLLLSLNFFLVFPLSGIDFVVIKCCGNCQSLSNDGSKPFDYNVNLLSTWSQNFGLVKELLLVEKELFLIGGDKEIFILNTTDLTYPKLLGSYHNNSGALTAVHHAGRLFLGLQNGLEILDVQNHSSIEQLAFYETAAVHALCLDNETLFLSRGSFGVEILNIANLSAITPISMISTAGEAHKIVLKNDCLFIADSVNGLEIYNVSNYHSPVKIANYTDGSAFFDLVVDEQFAYILDSSGNFKILNITDILAIKKISEMSFVHPQKLLVENGTVFLAVKEQVVLINCTDPLMPSQITMVNATSDIIALRKKNSCLFMSEKEGIEIVSLENFTSPEILSRFGYSDIEKVLIAGGYLYALMGEEGVAIIKATGHSILQAVSNYRTSGRIVDFCIAGRYLYLAVKDTGVEILDVLEPENPQKVGEYLSSGNASSLAIADNYLLLADGVAVKVITVADPSHPQEVAQYVRSLFIPDKVRFYEGKALVIDRDRMQVAILELTFSTATGPELLFSGMITGSQFIHFVDVAMQEHYIYLSTGNSLQVYDSQAVSINSPILTIEKGSYYALKITNNLLYAIGNQNFQILTITDLEQVNRTEFPLLGSFLVDIDVEKEYIVIGNFLAGDDLYLFNHTYPLAVEKRVWPYIVLPIGGVVGLAIPIVLIVRFRKKKTLHS